VASVGYTVTRRYGGAVERNRIRRRLRACVDSISGDLQAGKYLISTGPSAAELSFDQLLLAVSEATARASETRS